jgi:uncharacterized protein (TIGR02679 family)
VAFEQAVDGAFAPARRFVGDHYDVESVGCSHPSTEIGHARTVGRYLHQQLGAMASGEDESVGVVPDPLSSTVTALGLSGDASPLGRWLDTARAASEPVVLTLANLRRWPRPPLPSDQPAVVVENPSLLAEAAPRWCGPPLVCSSGRPTVAVVVLLRQLGAAGAPLYQHADFDPAGLAITAWLAARAGTMPWHMTAGDYLAAVRTGGATFGAVPETPWDPGLAVAMTARGVGVYEEDVRRDLLEAARAAIGRRG